MTECLSVEAMIFHFTKNTLSSAVTHTRGVGLDKAGGHT